MPGMDKGFPKAVYGVGVRDVLFPGELDYFKANPKTTGMAADDDMVILNPYSTLKDNEKQAVLMNEAARVHMRKGNIEPPRYDLTPEQTEAFKNYGGGDADAMRQTLAARILSGDPSAGKATPEQQEYANLLRSFMGVK
jgi:hypothetical protein